MNLYEIALPSYTNPTPTAPRFDYALQLREFRSAVLEQAGGCTDLGHRLGCWRDPSDGIVYEEEMQWFQIATTPKIMGELVELAFELFSDQQAIFYAVVGRAVIMPRHERVKAAVERLNALPTVDHGPLSKYEFDVVA